MMKEILKIKKIRKILLGSFSFLLLLFLPFSFVYGFWEGLVNILAAIALFVPLMVGLGFLTISTFFFGIVKDRIFEAPSYTGSDNPIVSFGFPTVQSLGNIIILMGILIVGLATILGIEEYRAQRKLPALIICALLLNFSNVLCGFVVDVSNVLMNEFLKRIGTFDIVWQIIKTNFLSFDTIKKMFSDIAFAGELFLSVIYCFLAGLIIFVLSLLLIIRKVAIPVLVVLAPAAIASYVMPDFPGMPEAFWGHRKFFNWWLHQFLQWCFVGVTVAFFVWLATGYIGNLSKLSFDSQQIDFPQMRVFAQQHDVTPYQYQPKTDTSPQVPAEAPPTLKRGNVDLNFISKLANYFGVIFMLYMAMQLGFQTSAFGAAAIIGFGQRVGAALRGEVGRRVGAGARRLRTEIGERMAKLEKLQNLGEKIKAGYQKIPAQIRTGLEYGLGRPIYAIRKGIGMATGFEYEGVVEESKKRLVEAKEKLKKEGADAKKLAQTILNPFMTLEDKVAAWAFAKETGQFGRVIKALKDQNADPDKLLVRHIQGIAPINPDLAKSLVKLNPHLAGEIKQGLSEKTAKALGLEVSKKEIEAIKKELGKDGLKLTDEEVEVMFALPMKILMQLSPEEFVSVNPYAQTKPVFQKYLASSRISVGQFRAFLEKGDPEAREEFIKWITGPKEKGGLGGWRHYKEIGNERVWNWILNSPAFRDLGFVYEEKSKEESSKIITSFTREELKKLKEEEEKKWQRK
jgi:hypothetical protein